MPTYLLKTHLPEPAAAHWTFLAQKTMYGGKRVAVGDTVYLIASEHTGGTGLVARGVVTAAQATPRRPDLARQTPRVDLQLQCTARAVRPLGRAQLRPFADWSDGRPETELNFKCYRQATDKLVGLSDAAAAFLAQFF